MRRAFAFLLVVAALSAAGDTFAQTGIPAGASSYTLGSMSLEVVPEFPDPGDEVLLKLVSGSVDLDNSAISWTVNGKVVATGVGQKSFTAIAGNAGSQTTITATAKAPGSAALSATAVVAPIAIDLIWQATTVTPPFYEGKAMYSPMSDLKFVAIPHMFDGNGEIPAGNLVYEWKMNGLVLGDKSGYGRNSIVALENVLGRPITVEVTVTDVARKKKANKEMTVSWFEPKLLVYENSPLYGVIGEKAITDETALKEKEISFWAFPYFFSPGTFGSNVTFTWTMNGKPLADANSNSMIFRNEDGRTGTSAITVGARYQGLMQQSSAKFNLKLDGGSGRSAF